MKAYVTLLSTVNYLPGVMGLYHSLKATQTKYDLWVALSSHIPETIARAIEDEGMKVLRLPDRIEVPLELQQKSGHWGHTFDKLHLFSLPGFSKLVYLDCDMMIMTNIDELFDRPHMSAVAAGKLVNESWTRLNSGLMVIEPQEGLAARIVSALDKAVAEVSAMGVQAIGDQDVINAYYSSWPQSPELHLDQGYNVFFTYTDAYIKLHDYRLPEGAPNPSRLIRVVHFIGASKPWMKWAGLRHFLANWRKQGSSKWERLAFHRYRAFIRQSSYHF